MSSRNRRARSSDATTSTAFRRVGIGLLVVAIAFVVWWRSSRSYPEASSAECLHLMRALYTACSSQNASRLSAVERKVESAKDKGSLTEPEYSAFVSIVARARDGNWKSAASDSYQFAQDQVR